MGFVAQWLWYLVAFIVGSAVAAIITFVSISRTSEAEATADLPGSRVIGAK
jgi:uncharacterized membrane protein ArfB